MLEILSILMVQRFYISSVIVTVILCCRFASQRAMSASSHKHERHKQ